MPGKTKRKDYRKKDMTPTLEYIEKYFTGSLSEDEQRAFEQRCTTDIEFAREVSFYVASRDALKEAVRDHKKKEFEELYKELSLKPRGVQRSFFPYVVSAAAACLLLFFTWIAFFKSPSPQQMADSYVEENLQTLSVTMGSGEDSLQLGISAYNKEDYSEAEKIFSALVNQESQKTEATKYLGLTYLKTERYNEAIAQFEKLSSYTHLFANSGPFYKAVALMKRGNSADGEEAKKLLQEVIADDLPGRKQAEEWMEKW